MRVYIIYDSLYENIVGAYSSEEKALDVAFRLNKQYRGDTHYHDYEIEDLELDGETIADEIERRQQAFAAKLEGHL